MGNKWAFNLATTLQLQLQLKVKRLNGNGQTQDLKKLLEAKHFNKKVASSCGSEGFVGRDEERQGKFIQFDV